MGGLVLGLAVEGHLGGLHEGGGVGKFLVFFKREFFHVI